ncbi:MAG: beta-propeller fold lactonase family protein [Erysipelotrichaceae bacterium]|nr:beta-propeller fold lactonase family protein [Erysipelotrichaceae bacterium]
MKKTFIYAGSVGTGKSGKGSISGSGEGVYSFLLEEDGLRPINVAESNNAGIICVSSDHKYIYAANETKDFDGGLNGSGGGVSAYRINEDGSLSKLNDSISYGSRTSNVAVSKDGRYLLCSNHGSHTTVTCSYVKDEEGRWILKRGFDDSSIASFHINEDGSIGELCDLKVFDGSGYWIYGGGQSTSHLHCVRVDDHGLVYGCNRGADEIEVLRLHEDGTLTVLNRYKTEKGYAPRHMEIDKENDILYVCNENYPCVSVYRVDPNNGELTHLQTIATMDEEYMKKHPLPHFEKEHCGRDEKNTSGMKDPEIRMPSDLHLSYDKRFLYVSNRSMFNKDNNGSIACFKVNEDHTLSFIEVFELPGRDPRGFNTSQCDNHLIVGLCDANRICIYETDEETGKITSLVNEIESASPASFVWL